MSKDFLGADQRKVVEGKKKEDIVGKIDAKLQLYFVVTLKLCMKSR